MICCERCNVWQHGPCVGVMSENEAPDVYYCEECRPDLHELGNRNQGYDSVVIELIVVIDNHVGLEVQYRNNPLAGKNLPPPLHNNKAPSKANHSPLHPPTKKQLDQVKNENLRLRNDRL
jgi:hypothetical protein